MANGSFGFDDKMNSMLADAQRKLSEIVDEKARSFDETERKHNTNLEDAQRKIAELLREKTLSFADIEWQHRRNIEIVLDNLKLDTQKTADEKVKQFTEDAEQRIELGQSRTTLRATIAVFTIIGALLFLAYNSYKDVLSLQNQISKDMIGLQSQILATQDRIQSVKKDLDKALDEVAKAKQDIAASKKDADIDLAAIKEVRQDADAALLAIKTAGETVTTTRVSAEDELAAIQKIKEETQRVLTGSVGDREQLSTVLKSAEERLAAITASQKAIVQSVQDASQAKDKILADKQLAEQARQQMADEIATVQKDRKTAGAALVEAQRDLDSIRRLREELEKKTPAPQ